MSMNINPPRPCPEGREIKGGQNPSNTSDWRPPRPGGSGPPRTINATPDAQPKMGQAIRLIGSPYAEWSDPRHFGGDRDGVISTLWNKWGEMIGEGSIILCGVPTWAATAMTLVS